MLVSSAVDRGLECRLGQTKDYKIGICFSAKHAALLIMSGIAPMPQALLQSNTFRSLCYSYIQINHSCGVIGANTAIFQLYHSENKLIFNEL
jgi:hypothetical protein